MTTCRLIAATMPVVAGVSGFRAGAESGVVREDAELIGSAKAINRELPRKKAREAGCASQRA